MQKNIAELRRQSATQEAMLQAEQANMKAKQEMWAQQLTAAKQQHAFMEQQQRTFFSPHVPMVANPMSFPPMTPPEQTMMFPPHGQMFAAPHQQASAFMLPQQQMFGAPPYMFEEQLSTPKAMRQGPSGYGQAGGSTPPDVRRGALLARKRAEMAMLRADIAEEEYKYTHA